VPRTALAEPLRITSQAATDGVVLLAVAGDVDIATAPQLRTSVLGSIHAPRRPDRVELDLAETTFFDAVGVRVLLDGLREAAESEVRFAVRNPSGVVAQVLVVAGVADILQVIAAPPA
jgi:anti-sigma B factor antagonist